MKPRTLSRTFTLSLAFAMVVCSFQAVPDDIDIFTPPQDESNVNRPNVLFVLDNSANWSREAQHWPGETQGQSEVSAIAEVVAGLPDDAVNIGVMEFITTGSSANQDSAYIRYHIRPMNATNKPGLIAEMNEIYGDINGPIEKRPQSNPFGNLMWDVYNYLAGGEASQGGAGTPASRADNAAYTTQYSKFSSPLTTNDTCTRTIVVFIGNNTSSGPTGDSAANIAALKALVQAEGGDADAANAAVAQIPFADYVVTSVPQSADFGYSSACYATQAACSTGENNAVCADKGYTSCTCSATAPQSCGATYHWNVSASNTAASGFSTISDTTTDSASTQYTGGTTYCRNSAPPGTCSPPAGTSSVVQDNVPVAGQRTTTYTSWVGACSFVNTAVACEDSKTKTLWEPRATKRTRVLVQETTYSTTTTNLGATTGCYTSAATCSPTDGSWNCSAFNGGCSCTTQGSSTGCAAGSRWRVSGNYSVTQAIQGDTFSAAPSGNTTTYMLDEWARFLRQTGVTIPGVTVDGAPVKAQVTTYTIDVFKDQQDAQFSALLYNAARVGGGKYFRANDKNALINALKQIMTEVQAVNSAFSSASLPVNATNRAQNENQVFIGVFKPDRTKDPGWFGNMKRYQLIQSGSTIDLGDSLNKSAINSQTGFIGDCAVSFWTKDSGTYWNSTISDDPDALGICTSNTTSDHSDLPDGPFVEKGAVAQVLRRGNAVAAAAADADGNFAVARNNYTIWYTDKTVPAAVGTLKPIAALNSGAGASNADTDNFFDNDVTTDDEEMVQFIKGMDILDEDADSPKARAQTEPRGTIHGDVVHSRPQPINYGGTTGVVVFYGANDGHFRAVKASNGQELWSMVAPEAFPKFARLRNNAPLVKYFGTTAPGPMPKDYFFDGSTGVYQTEIGDPSPQTWIFPTLRRGGNRVYALNVNNPASPQFMWSAGCDSTNCPAEYAAMGQTWGLPNVAFIKGWCGVSTPCDAAHPEVPVIVLSGGYDTCEDANTWTPNCSTAKGRGVYVIDAKTGYRIRYFDFSSLGGFTARSVVSDVALIDAVGDDKLVDYAYAVDTGGNFYRMDFVHDPSDDALDPDDVPGAAIANPANWPMSRIAYTNGLGHKFLFPPALVQITSTKIYLAIGTGDREHPLRGHYPYDERDGDDPAKSSDDDYDLVAGNNGTDDPGVTNRFYMFKDNLADINASTSINLNSACSDPLTANCMRNYSTPTTCASDTVLPNDTEAGWFIDLSGKGEQTVTSAVVAAGFVFFSTNRPQDEIAEACVTDLGEARGYFLNLLNASGAIGVTGACGGDRSSIFVGGGLPPSPVLATVPIAGADTNGDGIVDINDAGADKNGDGVVNELDNELRTVVIGAVQKTGEPSSPIQSQRVRPPIASDRKPIYWYKSTGDR